MRPLWPFHKQVYPRSVQIQHDVFIAPDQYRSKLLFLMGLGAEDTLENTIHVREVAVH